MTDESQERRTAHYIETYKALFVLGPFAIKLISVLNGGAALALLTYATQVRESIGDGGGERTTLGILIPAFVLLVLGLVVTGVSAVVGYISQLELFQSSKFQTGTSLAVRSERRARILLWCSIGLAIAALLLFAVGSIYAAVALA